MEKNYYEILEVDKNASPEIIEKAYKTLIKKFHPDLQEDNLKDEYEEKIKKINEAYEVLSNPSKKNEYNLFLENLKIQNNNENFSKILEENKKLKNDLQILQNHIQILENPNWRQEQNSSYNYNYGDNLNYSNRNVNIRPRWKWNLKSFISMILTLAVLALLGFLLWHIPFVKNYLINLSEENIALHSIIDFIMGLL